jgi:ABC-type multidrug transport system fused ATPase/permease subunit
MSSLGRLPKTTWAITLIIIGGLLEGFGLALFVPLIKLMTDRDNQKLQPPFEKIEQVFNWFGMPATLGTLLAAIVSLILLSLIILYIQRTQIIKLRHKYAHDMRCRFSSAVFSSSWPYLSNKPHGEAANELIIECNRASMALQYELFATGLIFQIAIYLGVSAFLSWELTTLVFAFCIAVAFLVRPKQRQAKTLGVDTVVANRNISFHMIEFLKGAKFIKASASEKRVIESLASHIGAYFRVAFSTEINSVQIYFLVQAMPVLLITAVILLAHYVLFLNPSFTLVFLLVLARIAPRLAQFQQYAQGYNVARPGLTLIDQMIEDAESEAEITQSGKQEFKKLNREIRFDQVSFQYPSRDKITLDKLSFSIPRHQMIAIVGPSGAGKSTIVDMISGLFKPDSGSVMIDSTPLEKYEIQSWRKRIGYVDQQVVIFNDTFRTNVAFACPEVDDAQIIRSLKTARLGDLLDELPDGLDTLLGERGTRFSGGQLQRLALARAIVGNPELLLLDEATSALDNESERLVQQAIEEIAQNFTLVVIAHRLSTVRGADMIHVIEDGKIVQSGTYDTLATEDGSFRRLHEMELR